MKNTRIHPIQVSVSILSANFTRLGDEIKKCEEAGADRIHLDVMDGHFVPNISIGQVILEAIRGITRLPIEAHLMIEHPWMYIDDFADKGADIIAVHAECYGELRPVCRGVDKFPKEVDSLDARLAKIDIERIQKKGKKAFMVFNPGTPVCLDKALLDALDGVLVMSVNPGYAGQKFMPEVLSKVRELRRRFVGDIAIDGGITNQTAPLAVLAGVNVLATASYFFRSLHPAETIRNLRNLK